MGHHEFIAWSKAQDAAGKFDAMGKPWGEWLVAVLDDAGKPVRDARGNQLFQTQAQYLASTHASSPATQPAIGQTLDLFA